MTMGNRSSVVDRLPPDARVAVGKGGLCCWALRGSWVVSCRGLWRTDSAARARYCSAKAAKRSWSSAVTTLVASSVSWLTAIVREGISSAGMPFSTYGSQKWRWKDLAESFGDAVHGDDEGLVFVEDLRDGNPQPCNSGAEIDEGFVGYRQLRTVELDQADLDGPLDVFLRDDHPRETLGKLVDQLPRAVTGFREWHCREPRRLTRS